MFTSDAEHTDTLIQENFLWKGKELMESAGLAEHR